MVDFGAPWCPPCRAVTPILEALASKYADRLAIVPVNTVDAPALVQKFAITGLPTMVVFKQGHEVQRTRGAAPKHVLEHVFDAVLAG